MCLDEFLVGIIMDTHGSLIINTPENFSVLILDIYHLKCFAIYMILLKAL